jgi:hypothetical protein
MKYTYGQHQWHSEYQALCKKRDSDSLEYVAIDCWRALEAMPQGPKSEQYWDEFWYCRGELRRRGEVSA